MYRNKYTSELCADIVTRLEGLRVDPDDDTSAVLFRSVQVHRRTQYRSLADVIKACSKYPAAIVIPGEVVMVEHGISAIRDQRETKVSIFVISSFYAERNKETLDTQDMADLVILTYQPDAATPARPIEVDNVTYEPEGSVPIEVVPRQDCIEVSIIATDAMQTR